MSSRRTRHTLRLCGVTIDPGEGDARWPPATLSILNNRPDSGRPWGPHPAVGSYATGNESCLAPPESPRSWARSAGQETPAPERMRSAGHSHRTHGLAVPHLRRVIVARTGRARKPAHPSVTLPFSQSLIVSRGRPNCAAIVVRLPPGSDRAMTRVRAVRVYRSLDDEGLSDIYGNMRASVSDPCGQAWQMRWHPCSRPALPPS